MKSQIVTMDADMAKLGEIIKTNNTELSNLRAEIEQLQTQLKDCNAKLKSVESTENPEEEDGQKSLLIQEIKRLNFRLNAQI